MAHPTTAEKSLNMHLYRQGFTKKTLRRLEQLQKFKDRQPQAKREYEKILTYCAERANEIAANERQYKNTKRRIEYLNKVIGLQYFIMGYEEYLIFDRIIKEKWSRIHTSTKDFVLSVLAILLSKDGYLIDTGPRMLEGEMWRFFLLVEHIRNCRDLYRFFIIYAVEKQCINNSFNESLRRDGYLEITANDDIISLYNKHSSSKPYTILKIYMRSCPFETAEEVLKRVFPRRNIIKILNKLLEH